MIASGYSMDLYCDVPGCRNPFYATQDQFTGETWGDCAAQARAKGWRISQDKQKCSCPKCTKSGRSY